jgi:hypothetical protein
MAGGDTAMTVGMTLISLSWDGGLPEDEGCLDQAPSATGLPVEA